MPDRTRISYRQLQVGMRTADRPGGNPRVTSVDEKGFATRWGWGYFPRVGCVKVLVSADTDDGVPA